MIKLQNISFTYGEQQVLHNITLNIERGQKIGIIGESGCGKSTLLKLIAGLYAPTSGTISVAGKTDPKEISKCVSVVMQTPMLLPLSIYENITLGHDYPADRIDQVCKMANIKNWIDSLPEGINT